MATTATNVYWSKEMQGLAVHLAASGTQHVQRAYYVTVTTTPEPPHELDVIQRMSEAFRRVRSEIQ